VISANVQCVNLGVLRLSGMMATNLPPRFCLRFSFIMHNAKMDDGFATHAIIMSAALRPEAIRAMALVDRENVSIVPS
jgi:hypothetical protein